MSLLSLWAVVMVSMHRWTPTAALCPGHYSRAGAGRVRARVRAAAALGLASAFPVPDGALRCVFRVNPGSHYPILGSWATFSGLSERRVPARDGRSGQAWDGGGGVLPATQCLEKDGGWAEGRCGGIRWVCPAKRKVPPAGPRGGRLRAGPPLEGPRDPLVWQVPCCRDFQNNTALRSCPVSWVPLSTHSSCWRWDTWEHSPC